MHAAAHGSNLRAHTLPGDCDPRAFPLRLKNSAATTTTDRRHPAERASLRRKMKKNSEMCNCFRFSGQVENSVSVRTEIAEDL